MTREEWNDLLQRFKVLEREQDDLHAAYRRLRASKAADAREPSPPSDPPPEGGGGTKAELRRRYLLPKVPTPQ